MTHRFPLSLILGVSLLVFAAPFTAGAATVFNNFGPGLTYDINSGNSVGNAFDGNNYAEANTFTATFSGSFQSLLIALSCAFACPDPFSVSLTADNGNQPGLVLESFSVPGAGLGPIGIYNAPILLNSVLMPQLTSGAQYWVAVASGLTNSISWNLNITGDVSAQAISSDGGATWFSPSGNTPGALEVEAIPEPGALGLLASGGLMLGLLRRRRVQ